MLLKSIICEKNSTAPGLAESPTQLYTGRDPLFPSQRIPKGDVDVAAIVWSLPPQTTTRQRSLSLISYLQQTPVHSPTTNSTLLKQNKLRSRKKNRKNAARHLSAESTSGKGITPGEGWTVLGHPAGFCDGTSNAECHREPFSTCLMSGHNDARGILKGDGLSGWLVFDLKDVKEGIFMARVESWHQYNSNPRTENWEAVNNGRDDSRRRLKAKPPPLPDDFVFEGTM